ncbi:MAG: serine/threonine protein kinase [Deltaproteobacteria bacterium]|nr:serine/threonine protein kinase [Deltaproteobacteria bacterium]MCB9785267.1 serine/threonine protein kinase [Deltaproteobacteria bacterium]
MADPADLGDARAPADPADPRDRMLGATLRGAYRLDAIIGRGTMGAVYRATRLRDGRPVAVKVQAPEGLLSDPSRRDEFRRRFERETVATLTLDHPNTVKVIDFGTHEGSVSFLVLELLRGRTLRELLATRRGLGSERTARIAVQMARALEHAHGLDIVHRDLKPENVFICDGGDLPDHVKVMDFGIVRLLGKPAEATQLTRVGHSLGTLAYMSPEQATNRPVGPATDIYSLGVMIHEMLTGRPPFEAANPLMIAVMHIENAPPPLAVPGMEPALMARWQELLDRLLSKAEGERPRRAGEVARALTPMLTPGDRRDLEALRPTGPARRVRSAPREATTGEAPATARSGLGRLWLWAVLALAVGATGAGLAWLVAWLRG